MDFDIRVFDALAAGCLVITNSRPVSDELFGGALPVYDDAKTLHELSSRQPAPTFFFDRTGFGRKCRGDCDA